MDQQESTENIQTKAVCTPPRDTEPDCIVDVPDQDPNSKRPNVSKDVLYAITKRVKDRVNHIDSDVDVCMWHDRPTNKVWIWITSWDAYCFKKACELSMRFLNDRFEKITSQKSVTVPQSTEEIQEKNTNQEQTNLQTQEKERFQSIISKAFGKLSFDKSAFKKPGSHKMMPPVTSSEVSTAAPSPLNA